MVVVKNVKLPAEIFRKLKELHYKDRQFKDMLMENFNLQMFEASIPVNIEYNDFKAKITNEYIPKEFQSDRYVWNADFYSEVLVIQDTYAQSDLHPITIPQNPTPVPFSNQPWPNLDHNGDPVKPMEFVYSNGTNSDENKCGNVMNVDK